jgi:hypothetical protein
VWFSFQVQFITQTPVLARERKKIVLEMRTTPEKGRNERNHPCIFSRGAFGQK